MSTYNTAPIATTVLFVSVGGLAWAVCASLVGTIGASTAVACFQDRSTNGCGSHKSEEHSGELHREDGVVYCGLFEVVNCSGRLDI